MPCAISRCACRPSSSKPRRNRRPARSPMSAWRSAARTAQSVTFSRDLDRLNVIVDSNGLVAARLVIDADLARPALRRRADLPVQPDHRRLGRLLAAASRSRPARRPSSSLTSILNTSVNGEYLFAGTNTDVKPINDFTAAGSPGQGGLRRLLRHQFRLHARRSGRRQHHRRPDGRLHHQRCRRRSSSARAGRPTGRMPPTSRSSAASRSTKPPRPRPAPTTTASRKLAMAAAMVTSLMSSNISQAAKDTHRQPLADAGRRSAERHRPGPVADRHRRRSASPTPATA